MVLQSNREHTFSREVWEVFSECSEEINHLEIWAKPVLGKGKANKRTEGGMRVMCLRNSKKASMAGTQRTREE